MQATPNEQLSLVYRLSEEEDGIDQTTVVWLKRRAAEDFRKQLMPDSRTERDGPNCARSWMDWWRTCMA